MSTTTTNGATDTSKDLTMIPLDIGDKDGESVGMFFGFEIPELPRHTVNIAVRRALSHVLSNEVKSKSAADLEKLVAERTKAGEEPWTDAEAKEQREEIEEAARERFVDMFRNGTWGDRGGATGPRLTGFDAEYKKLVNKTVRDKFAELVKRGSMVYNAADKTWLGANGGKIFSLEDGVKEFEASQNPETVAKRAAIVEAAHEAVSAKARLAEIAKMGRAESAAGTEAVTSVF